MKKLLLAALILVTFTALGPTQVSAVTNNLVKVGLRYGSTAMSSANLENAEGAGYEFGYFDANRNFVLLGRTDITTITMHAGSVSESAAGTHYMGEAESYAYRTTAPQPGQTECYATFTEAAEAAAAQGGWPAWINGRYTVRSSAYAQTTEYSSTSVVVTKTGTTQILFEYDSGGARALGVQPAGNSTWFRGYKYAGGFEYPRASGGNLSVINVVSLEDYVKGIVPYEMLGSWPLAALEAQAVCARTFVCGHTKHLSSQGFDVCATQDCQVYYGQGSGSNGPTSTSNQAVDNTAGLCIYYNGTIVQNAVYHSFDGGATEDGANVWGTETGYLKGKLDPYESQTNVPNYSYTVTYTPAELSWILDQKGHSVGTVQDAYVSEYTPLGNVYKVTFVGTSGTETVTGETCRTIFYSSTYNKSVTSMRFRINGKGADSWGASGISTTGGLLSSLNGAAAITGSGAVETVWGDAASAITASGVAPVTSGTAVPAPVTSSGNNSGNFVITGTGSGHNVGMSQYGAKAMAELGYDFRDILEFYYTDITIN
ncbi:MAG: SpoIID/LytB domain-containing protein [Oscillibacter sp.]|nr:SpoIID/LytB domain-containing protein [Oscillibacter sp.]